MEKIYESEQRWISSTCGRFRQPATAQRCVRASSSTALGGAYAITLPPVGEACGMVFSVYADSIADSATITVQDPDESIGWSDLSLTTTADHVVVYSDGLTWHVLHETTT